MAEGSSREEENKKSAPVITVKTEDLEPGMKTAKAVVNRFGGIIMPAGVILTKNEIKSLQKMPVFQVKIIAEDKKEIAKNLAKIQQLKVDYQENVKKAASLFKKALSQGEIDYVEVEYLTEEAKNFGQELEVKDLLSMVRNTDEYTYTHLLHVSILANMFGHWLELEEERTEQLTRAGLLHDIGKAKISSNILNKKGTLSPREFQKIKKHPLYGYEMVKDQDSIADATAKGILCHHERYNGLGYPMELKGKKIPYFGRILAIVDTFDAIVADRVYKPARSPFEALKIFREETFSHYDYELKKVFMERLPECFVQEKVVLNNGKEAEIVFINPGKPEHPIIKMDERYLDLYEADGLKIDSFVNADNQ